MQNGDLYKIINTQKKQYIVNCESIREIKVLKQFNNNNICQYVIKIKARFIF